MDAYPSYVDDHFHNIHGDSVYAFVFAKVDEEVFANWVQQVEDIVEKKEDEDEESGGCDHADDGLDELQ